MYKKNISEFLDQQRNYWSLNDFSTEDRKKMQRLLHFSQIAFKVYIISGTCCVTTMLVVPWISVREEPFACWIPNRFNFNFTSIYVAQFIFLVYIFFLLIGFDILFMVFCVHILIQLKLLKIKLRNVNFSNGNEVKAIVKQHDFLIKYILIQCLIFFFN